MRTKVSAWLVQMQISARGVKGSMVLRRAEWSGPSGAGGDKVHTPEMPAELGASSFRSCANTAVKSRSPKPSSSLYSQQIPPMKQG